MAAMDIDMAQANTPSPTLRSRKNAAWPGTLGWCMAALAGMMAVLLINGAPLFYFDTAGYLRQGDSIFQILNLFQPVVTNPNRSIAELATNDGIVIGSRSVVYAIFLSLISVIGPLWIAVATQAAILAATIWLICSKATEAAKLDLSPLKITAVVLFAASLGSAGFYIASLMPDIFAPVLLLSMAALIAFAPVLQFWSALAFVMLGMLAAVVHPSHLAIAVLMVPICFVVAYLFQTGQLWRSMILVALIPTAGLVERLAFKAAVEQSTDSDVIYLPFSTARLISDGPGLVFLKGVCPSPKWATCALYAKLHSPDQLSPAEILFSQTEKTGSFALLDAKDREAISTEAVAFFRAVILGYPIDAIRAALGNTFEQLGLVGINMTVPKPAMVQSAVSIHPGFPESLTAGRLIADNPAWVAYVTYAHKAYYLLALITVLALILMPRSRVPTHQKAFTVLILAGILINAFVTGAISQPADRYGARVVFLIPMLAVLLVMIRQPRPDRIAEG